MQRPWMRPTVIGTEGVLTVGLESHRRNLAESPIKLGSQVNGVKFLEAGEVVCLLATR